DLARTFEAVASEGAKHLYGGALGKAIVAHLASLGGCITLQGLAEGKATWEEPTPGSHRGLTANLPPPPREGFQFLLTLRILEGFNLAAMERNGTQHLDTVLRAIRLAAGVRIAHNNPSPQRLAELLSDDHVGRLRDRLRDGKPVSGPTEQWMPTP